MGTHFLRSMAGTVRDHHATSTRIANLPLATATTLNYTSPALPRRRRRRSCWARSSRAGSSRPSCSASRAWPCCCSRPSRRARRARPWSGSSRGSSPRGPTSACARSSRQGEPEWRILFWFGVFGTVGCAAWQLAFSTFHPVSWDNAWILLGIGVLGTLAQLAMTRAYRTGQHAGGGVAVVLDHRVLHPVHGDVLGRQALARWAGRASSSSSRAGSSPCAWKRRNKWRRPDLKAELLVSTETLAAHLGDPDWIVFDTRHDLAYPDKGRQAWQAAHIPGAYFMHMDEDLSGAKTGKNGRHPLPRPRRLRRAHEPLRRRARPPGRGLRRRRRQLRRAPVVDAALAGARSRGAARRRVRRVEAREPPARRRSSPRRARDASSRAPRQGATVDAPYVAASLASTTVVRSSTRARPPASWARTRRSTPWPGTSPAPSTASGSTTSATTGASSRRRSCTRSSSRCWAMPIPRSSSTRCGSGVTACHNLFAMELAGLAGSRLYPGLVERVVRGPVAARGDRPEVSAAMAPSLRAAAALVAAAALAAQAQGEFLVAADRTSCSTASRRFPPRSRRRPRRTRSSSRSAMLDWHPAKREILVRQRPGNANQLHRVAEPGAAPEPLTDYADPVAGGRYEPRARRRYSSSRAARAATRSTASTAYDPATRQSVAREPGGRAGERAAPGTARATASCSRRCPRPQQRLARGEDDRAPGRPAGAGQGARPRGAARRRLVLASASRPTTSASRSSSTCRPRNRTCG